MKNWAVKGKEWRSASNGSGSRRQGAVVGSGRQGCQQKAEEKGGQGVGREGWCRARKWETAMEG